METPKLDFSENALDEPGTCSFTIDNGNDPDTNTERCSPSSASDVINPGNLKVIGGQKQANDPPVRRSPRKTSKEAQQRVIEAARGPTRSRKTADKADASKNAVKQTSVAPEKERLEDETETGSVRRSQRHRVVKGNEHDASDPQISTKQDSSVVKTTNKRPGRKPGNTASPRSKTCAKTAENMVTVAKESSLSKQSVDGDKTEKQSRSTESSIEAAQSAGTQIFQDAEAGKSVKLKDEFRSELQNDTSEQSAESKSNELLVGSIIPKGDSTEIKQKQEQDTESDSSDLDDGEVDDDDDSDFDPDEDPHKLYCICSKPHGNRFMICCDKCEEWFHGDCVGITITRGREMDKNDEEWICPRCEGTVGKKPALSTKSQNVNKVERTESSSSSKENGDQGGVKADKKDINASVKLDSASVITEGNKSTLNESTQRQIKGTKRRESIGESKSEKEVKKLNKSGRVITGLLTKSPSFEVEKDKNEKGKQMEGLKLLKEKENAVQTNRIKKEQKEGNAITRRQSQDAPSYQPNSNTLDNNKETRKEKTKQNQKMTSESPTLDGTFTYEKVKDLKLKRQRSLDGNPDRPEQKKGKESKTDAKTSSVVEKTQGDDEFPRRRKPQEQRFRIPKKVRTTPTPKTFNPISNVRSCIGEGCQKQALKNAIYCSSKCISRYTEHCLLLLEEEKQRKFGAALAEATKTASDASKPTDDTSVDDCLASHKILANDRIAVVEKSSGKLLAGVMAPTKEKLIPWLEEHPTYEVLTTGKTTAAPKKEKKDQDDIVRNNVKRSLKETLLSRCREVDLTVDAEEVAKLAQIIEQEMFGYFADTGQKYKTKYRSLIFNLKDHKNRILYKRVVMGDISPEKLVRMSPEQLASSELAKWREREAKHNLEMIKKREEEEATMSKHAVKKTHKGEIEIDQDENLAETLEVKSDATEERGQPSAAEGGSLLEDTTEQHSTHLFDLNCKICTGKLTPPGEKQTVTNSLVASNITDDITETSVPSPTEEDRKQRPPSLNEFSEAVTALPTRSKEVSVWKGFIMMQNVSKFVTRAYRVSGTCDNLLQILPDTIHVCGRIPHEEVWDYLYQLKSSTNKVIDVLRFEMASADEKAGYVALYSYFYTRKRIGVVGNCYSGVKDMYLVPLASHDPVPPELKPFDGPGLPSPRPHMLLGIIIKLRQSTLKRSKSHGEKHDGAKKKRKCSLSTPPDSPGGPVDQIVYSHLQHKKASSSKSSASSESSNTPTPDLGSPSSSSLSVPVSSTTPSPTPSVPAVVSISSASNSKDMVNSVPPVEISAGVGNVVNLPSVLTNMMAPIASSSSSPFIQPNPEHHATESTHLQVSQQQQLIFTTSSLPEAKTSSTVVSSQALAKPSPAFSTLDINRIDAPLMTGVETKGDSHGTLQGGVQPESMTSERLQGTGGKSESENAVDNKQVVSPDDEPYDPEDDFVIDLIEDIPLPTPKDKSKLPLPLDMPKREDARPLPALPPLPLPGMHHTSSVPATYLRPHLLPDQANLRPIFSTDTSETYVRGRPLDNFSQAPNPRQHMRPGSSPAVEMKETLPEFASSVPNSTTILSNRGSPYGHHSSHPHGDKNFEHWPKDDGCGPPQRPTPSSPVRIQYDQFTPQRSEGSEPHIVPVSPVSLTAPENNPWIQDRPTFPQVAYISPPHETDRVPKTNPAIAQEVHSFLRETRKTQEGTGDVHGAISFRNVAHEAAGGHEGPAHAVSVPDARAQECPTREFPRREGFHPRWHPEDARYHERPPHPLPQQEPLRQGSQYHHEIQQEGPRSNPLPPTTSNESCPEDDWQRNSRRPGHYGDIDKGGRDMRTEEVRDVPTLDHPGRGPHHELPRPFRPRNEQHHQPVEERPYVHPHHRQANAHHLPEPSSTQPPGHMRLPPGPPGHPQEQLLPTRDLPGRPHGHKMPFEVHPEQQHDRVLPSNPRDEADMRRFETKAPSYHSNTPFEYENRSGRRHSAEPSDREQPVSPVQRSFPPLSHSRDHPSYGQPVRRPSMQHPEYARIEPKYRRMEGQPEMHGDVDIPNEGGLPHRDNRQAFDNFDSARHRGFGRGRSWGPDRAHAFPHEESEWNERDTPVPKHAWGDRALNRQDIGQNNPNQDDANSFERNPDGRSENRYVQQTVPFPWRNRRTSDPGRFQRGRPTRGSWQ